ncbi:MAG: nicotinamide-nucleotide amidohydrolase family protein [Gammaproteobacteria bacterium]|nr:nicotinamide-nucleotide amidohydrolase family protein [Gammaproteobacteria bacterium]
MDDEEILALARRLGAAMTARGWKLVTAESCTGGWVSAAVTAIPGSSDWFDRGYVVYSYAAKEDLLGVAAESIRRHGAVSDIVVGEMLTGALRGSGAQLGVAISGIAGPTGGSPKRPVGTVCFAFGGSDGERVVETCLFDGDRQAIRRQAVMHALAGLLARC